MGVDTKGYVLNADTAKFNKTIHRVGNAVHKIVEDGYKALGNDKWSLPTVSLGLDMFHTEYYTTPEMFHIHFTYDGEKRILTVHSDIRSSKWEECYHFPKGSTGIVMSIGMWGSSKEIMKGILENLKDMGECYLEPNDSTEEKEKI
tara:strand:+ start:219 stop:656 length:438 start_codon:yes stop_codon:yes gene_type:complete